MTVFIVNYDLRKPAQDYDGLHDALEGFKDYHHALQSFWLVETDSYDAGELKDKLKKHIDRSDSLIVIKKCESGKTWAYTGASDFGDWIKSR